MVENDDLNLLPIVNSYNTKTGMKQVKPDRQQYKRC